MAIEKEEPTVLADTGHYNGIEIKNCIDDKMKVYIKKARANNSTKNNEFRKEKFTYDKEQDIYIYPAGNSLSFFENTSKNGIKYRRYKCLNCDSCKYKDDCTSAKKGELYNDGNMRIS